MVEMILNERSFRLTDRLLDGVELLRDVKARPPRGKHVHHAAEMAFGALQALDDVWV